MIYSTSLICCDQANVRADVDFLYQHGFKNFHADFMDGHFVPRLGICPELLMHLRNTYADSITIDSHLMMNSPKEFIKDIAPLSDIIWIHRETPRAIEIVDYIKQNFPTVKVGLAYRIETPIETSEFLKHIGVSAVMLMGINPGVLGSAKYKHLLYTKLSETEMSGFRGEIVRAVDGCVDFEGMTILNTYSEILVCGSSTIFKGAGFDSNRYSVVLENLKRLKA